MIGGLLTGCASGYGQQQGRVAHLEMQLHQRDQQLRHQQQVLATQQYYLHHQQRQLVASSQQAVTQPRDGTHEEPTQALLLQTTGELLKANEALLASNQDLRERLARVETSLEGMAAPSIDPHTMASDHGAEEASDEELSRAFELVEPPPAPDEVAEILSDVRKLVSKGLVRVIVRPNGQVQLITPKPIPAGDPWL